MPPDQPTDFKKKNLTPQDFKGKQAHIINLSSMVPWKTGPGGIQMAGFKAFAELCHLYAKPRGCCRRAKNLLFNLSNYAWVVMQYNSHLKTHINSYKLGQMTSDVFLSNLLSIFSFLETASFPDSLRMTIWSDVSLYFSLRNTEAKQASDLSNNEVALALLEQAWNKPIDFSKTTIDKISKAIELAKNGGKVILISNTNEINAVFIIKQLVKEFPTTFYADAVNHILLESDSQKLLVEIAPNIYICFSYLMHQFKTSPSVATTKDVLTSTPSLLCLLQNNFLKRAKQVLLYSQFYPDIQQAIELNWLPINVDILFSSPTELFLQREFKPVI